MEEFDESKVKILFVPKREMLGALIGSEYKNHIKFDTFPEDYKVLGVEFDFRTQGFNFIIWHDSFDPVIEGACIEMIDPIWMTTTKMPMICRRNEQWN